MSDQLYTLQYMHKQVMWISKD